MAPTDHCFQFDADRRQGLRRVRLGKEMRSLNKADLKAAGRLARPGVELIATDCWVVQTVHSRLPPFLATPTASAV